MNKKLLVITFAIALMGQSMRASCIDTLKELFINWPLAFKPETWSDDSTPAVLREKGKKFQTAPHVTYNAEKKIFEEKNEQGGITEVPLANGKYLSDDEKTCFVLKDNKLILVDVDGKVDGKDVPSNVFVVKKESKIMREDKIRNLEQKAKTPAQHFRIWKLRHFEQQWNVAFILFSLAGLSFAGKKIYDWYQKRAAQQAAIDFDEFEDEEDDMADETSMPRIEKTA
jgi:hypothetical protein